jgi:hypothetical protein
MILQVHSGVKHGCNKFQHQWRLELEKLSMNGWFRNIYHGIWSVYVHVFDWLFHGILVILLWIWMDMANLARRWCVCVKTGYRCPSNFRQIPANIFQILASDLAGNGDGKQHEATWTHGESESYDFIGSYRSCIEFKWKWTQSIWGGCAELGSQLSWAMSNDDKHWWESRGWNVLPLWHEKIGSKWFKGLIRSYKRMMENIHPFKIMKDSLIVWRPCRRHANIHMNLL